MFISPLRCFVSAQRHLPVIGSVRRGIKATGSSAQLTRMMTREALEDKASEWSRVAKSEASAIDEGTCLFDKLGANPILSLCTNFYTRVYEDKEKWFRSMFDHATKEEAVQNLYEFLVQRLGGPPLYTDRKGHPALIRRHRRFSVTHQAAEKWLNYMQQAMDNTPEIDSDSKTKLMNYIRVDVALGVFGHMLKHGGCARPNTVILNSSVKGLCLANGTADAEELVGRMPAMGCPPNTVSYNTLIGGHCAAGNTGLALGLLGGMGGKNRGCEPDVDTYTTVIDSCSKQGNVNVAMRLLGGRWKPEESCRISLPTGLYFVASQDSDGGRKLLTSWRK